MIAELDKIIQILEAEIPANPNSPKNLRQRKRLEQELVKYFDKLEKAFPYSKLAGIYNRYAIIESMGSEVGGIIDPLLATFDDTLTTEINGQLTETYISGQAEMVSWGKTKAGIPIAYEGPPIQGAIDWAGKHGATLVTGMDKETKKRLAGVISRGIENKRGIPGLSRDIRSTFSDMSKHRSELIARTETSNALSQASLDTMSDMGIEGKEWVTAGDDLVSDECEANETEGVIPVNQAFSGGVMAPPQHPDCRCTVAPSRLPVGKAPEPKAPPTKPVKPPGKLPSKPTRPSPKAKPEGPTGADWKKALTRDEGNAVNNWQYGGHSKIRQLQRTGQGDAWVKKQTKLFDSALNRDGNYTGKTFRGLKNLDDKVYNAIVKSDSFIWDAHTSASKSLKIANQFSKSTRGKSVLFEIQTKTGVDISSYATGIMSDLQEVILRQGMQYKVVGRKMEGKVMKMILAEV